MTAVPTEDRLFQAVFEGTLDALLLIDGNGTLTDTNETAGELFGCPAAELVGRPIAELFASGTDVKATRDTFLVAGESRGTLEVQRPDGGSRTVEFAASAGIYLGVHLVVIRDISEREAKTVELRRRTELLTKVFEASPVGIVIVDADGTIADANGRAESVLGLDREGLRDRTYDDRRWRPIRTDGTPIGSEELPVARVLATGEAVFDVQHGIKGPDGETMWLSVNAAPIHGNGKIEQIVAIVSDVTETREYRRLLEQQNRRLEEYSATVSHDLRGPLSVASGWLDVAIDENGSAESLEKVHDALERMGDLIADLRALGRYGQTVEGMIELDLDGIAREAWANVDTHDMTLRIEAELGSIAGERGRVLQLFENLFRNAFEHAGADTTVRVGPLDRGFFLEDDGPGIPERSRESVLEFGYSTVDGGTGIGLAIVDAVADAHGWDLEITDAETGGARFEFRRRWHPDRPAF